VLEDGPALGEQGESALSAAAQVAQVAQQCVPGTGVDVGFLASWRVFHGDEDAGTFVATVGEGRHSGGDRAVEGEQGMPPWRWAFPECQASISLPFTLVTDSEQRSVAKTLPSRITYGTPSAVARSVSAGSSG